MVRHDNKIIRQDIFPPTSEYPQDYKTEIKALFTPAPITKVFGNGRRLSITSVACDFFTIFHTTSKPSMSLISELFLLGANVQ